MFLRMGGDKVPVSSVPCRQAATLGALIGYAVCGCAQHGTRLWDGRNPEESEM